MSQNFIIMFYSFFSISFTGLSVKEDKFFASFYIIMKYKKAKKLKVIIS